MLLDLLRELERNELSAMLRESSTNWNSYDIDFHAPRIERLWRTWRDVYRLNLHVIHPCELERALYHPHAWPAAIHVVQGEYRMVTGYGVGDVPPPHSFRLVLPAGSYYEMIHKDAWHAEFPRGAAAYTITLSGVPWKRSAPKSPHALRPVSESRVENILATFQSLHAR